MGRVVIPGFRKTKVKMGGEIMKANILGTIYKIKRKTLKNSNTDGWCDNTSKTIVIRKDNYNNVGNFEYLMKKQLRHEIIHAYLSESGLQSNFENCTQWGHNETMVDWIAIQFPKIYKTYEELNILN